jgi:hypothetical protein
VSTDSNVGANDDNRDERGTVAGSGAAARHRINRANPSSPLAVTRSARVRGVRFTHPDAKSAS